MFQLNMQPCDAVHRAITETYGREGAKDWRPGSPFEPVTMDVLSAMVRAQIEYADDPEQIFAEVRNQIWNWYSGGGTARNCARRVYDNLGLKVPIEHRA